MAGLAGIPGKKGESGWPGVSGLPGSTGPPGLPVRNLFSTTAFLMVLMFFHSLMVNLWKVLLLLFLFDVELA